MNLDTLYHHGIRGQRWGIRRYQNADGSLTPEGKKRYGSGDSTPASKPKRKSSSEMTDEELRAMVNRLNLESQYNRLVKEIDGGTVSRGQNAITSILNQGVTQGGTELTKKAVIFAGALVINGLFKKTIIKT